MIINAGSMQLQCIWNVVQGQVNDVAICKELNTMQNFFHTLWIVKDHETSKKILEMFADAKEEGMDYPESFPMGQNLCFIFPYHLERPLSRFYTNTIDSGVDSNIIWQNYVKACMAIKVPAPILYMLIKQGQVQLEKDGNLFFNYSIDLATLDRSKQSAECAALCGEELLKLLGQDEEENVQGYELISNKLKKQQYADFTQVYRDIKLVIEKQEKIPLIKSLHQSVQNRGDALYRFLFLLCMVLLVLVIIITVSHMLYGEIPFLRIFQPLFQQIGTESLLQ